MTEAIFYVLKTSQPRDRNTIACKIAEKAYKQGKQVFVLAESEQQTREIDNLLWSFRQGSFVPHLIADDNKQQADDQLPNTVLIGTNTIACQAAVLINLTRWLPDDPQVFERIVEIIDQDAQIKQAGRKHYKKYQSLNIEIKTHNL